MARGDAPPCVWRNLARANTDMRKTVMDFATRRPALGQFSSRCAGALMLLMSMACGAGGGPAETPGGPLATVPPVAPGAGPAMVAGGAGGPPTAGGVAPTPPGEGLGAEPTGLGGASLDPGTAGAAGRVPCDVAAIISEHCTTCHADTPRFNAPMSLVSADDFNAPAPITSSEPV